MSMWAVIAYLVFKWIYLTSALLATVFYAYHSFKSLNEALN
jgi:hypothetical protein